MTDRTRPTGPNPQNHKAPVTPMAGIAARRVPPVVMSSRVRCDGRGAGSGAEHTMVTVMIEGAGITGSGPTTRCGRPPRMKNARQQ